MTLSSRKRQGSYGQSSVRLQSHLINLYFFYSPFHPLDLLEKLKFQSAKSTCEFQGHGFHYCCPRGPDKLCCVPSLGLSWQTWGA